MPRFSIIIPTYNRADSVLHTLESCFTQSFSDFEIVVVDDGSTDQTVDVLQSITDPRLVIETQANAGPAAARNTGMQKATGDYLAFLDSDDVWYPDFLACADAMLQDNPNQVLYGQIIVDRGVGRYWVKPDRAIAPGESIYDYLYVDGMFIQTSTIVMPSHLKNTVRWDENVTFGDNDQFAIDLWHTNTPFALLPKPLTLYADVLSADALSQLPIFGGDTSKHTNFFDWMRTQKDLMSEKAWAGYQARFESVGLAKQSPVKALQLLWRANRAGAMSVKGAVRQALQCFFPAAYRRLVDQYVRFRGNPLSDIQR